MASRLHAYTVRRTLRIMGVIVLIILLAVLFGFLIARAFELKRVEVEGAGIAVSVNRDKLGQSLLFLQTARVREELLENYPLLFSVRFEKKFPDTLIIHLIKRQPYVILVSRGIQYPLDRDGYVLDAVPRESGYPVFFLDTPPLSVGSPVKEEKVRTGLTFLTALSGSVPVSTIREVDGAYLAARSGNTNIFLPQKGDIRGKAATLQTIIEGFRIKGNLPSVIDLRFDKPVVTN